MLDNPDTYPDMDNIGNHNIGKDRKLSELLKEEIDTTNYVIAEFRKVEDDTVYSLQYKDKLNDELCEMGGVFKTLEDVDRYIERKGCDEEYWSEYAICKRYRDSSLDTKHHCEKQLTLTYKRMEGNSFALFDYYYQSNTLDRKRNTESTLGQIWIYVPTPFEEGDIVDTHSQYGKGVIKHLCTQNADFVKQAVAGGCYDSSDMTCYCYFLNKDNVYWECCHAYDKMEYVNQEDLEGFERILVAISSLVKKEITVDLFLDAYDFIKAEYAREIGNRRLRTYTDEGLKLAGLKRKTKNRRGLSQ